jgi:hypothetical protein
VTTSLFALEQAARAGDVWPAVEVLLDEFESLGVLGMGERIAQLRAQIMQLARSRSSIWAQQPETTTIDFYALTLDLPELDAVRRAWVSMLDTHGPWLRPLRASSRDSSVVSELRTSATVPLADVISLRFESEQQLAFTCHVGEHQRRIAWSWPSGRLEQLADLEPISPQGPRDPRFERGEDAPLYRATPDSDARPLPWEAFGNADAQMSADGRTIFVYGWYEDYDGLLLLVDSSSLQVMRRHEFDRPVSDVIERPGTHDLLVTTYGGLTIVGLDGRSWVRPGATDKRAWSPSGRYVCMIKAGVVQVIDTHADRQSHRTTGGLPLSFSPDGARLVDGTALLDGHTGEMLGLLDVSLGNYLEGGPAWPWWHVGTELIVCIHGGLALWDTRTGERVPPGDRLHASHWHRIAYSRTGRCFARGRGHTVTLGSLPSTESLAEITFDLEIERLAVSADAQLIAAYGAGQFEIRDRNGELIRVGQTHDRREPQRNLWGDGSFRFSVDERRLILSEPARKAGEGVAPDEVIVWDIASIPAVQVSDDLESAEHSLPHGWTVESGPVSWFCRADSPLRTKIVVPSAGPWLANPRHPRILACPGGLFELRDNAASPGR